MRVVLICCVILFMNSVSAQSRGNQAIRVIVQDLNFEAFTSNIEAVGTAEALQSVNLYPAVSDRVTGIYFTPGQTVTKGDLLLSLDARKQQIALERAEIELTNATRNYQRLIQSKSNGAVTQSALDDAQTNQDLAKVTLKSAQIELNDRKVLAPFTGVVGLTDVEVGDRISTNTLITTIDNQNQLFVNFSAPESSLQALNNNQSKVTLTPWSDRNTSLPAVISQVDSRVSEQNRTIRVRAMLNNTNSNYLPGMSFRVKLEVQGQAYAVVPESALSWGASDAYVWKVVDNKAKRISVQVQQRLRGRLLVTGELNDSDVLIVEGIQRLRPNDTVEIVDKRIPS